MGSFKHIRTSTFWRCETNPQVILKTNPTELLNIVKNNWIFLVIYNIQHIRKNTYGNSSMSLGSDPGITLNRPRRFPGQGRGWTNPDYRNLQQKNTTLILSRPKGYYNAIKLNDRPNTVNSNYNVVIKLIPALSKDTILLK